MDILKQRAADRGISLAELRREIVTEYLLQFDYSEEDQGLKEGTTNEQEERGDPED